MIYFSFNLELEKFKTCFDNIFYFANLMIEVRFWLTPDPDPQIIMDPGSIQQSK